jgi:hypothetical protein
LNDAKLFDNTDLLNTYREVKVSWEYMNVYFENIDELKYRKNWMEFQGYVDPVQEMRKLL